MQHTLGLDLDGVAADYVAGFRSFVSQSTGRSPESLKYPIAWSFVESGWFGSTKEYLDAHAAAVNAGMYRTMPVVPGAPEALQKIHDRGTRIVVMTSRFLPNTDPEQVVADTKHWLDANNIPVDEFHFLEDKTQVDADIYFEDSPQNIIQLQESGLEVVVFDHPYNRHVEGDIRVGSWDEASTVVYRHRVLREGREYASRKEARTEDKSGQSTVGFHSKPLSSLVSQENKPFARAKRCDSRNKDGSRCRRRGVCPVHS